MKINNQNSDEKETIWAGGMNTAFLIRAIISGFLVVLVGCGEQQRDPSPSEAPNPPTVETKKSSPGVPLQEDDLSSSSITEVVEPENTSELDPVLEAKVDQFFEGKDSLKEVMADPKFIELWDALDEPIGPSAQRMASALQLAARVVDPTIEVLTEETAPNLNIETDDPELLRSMIRAALKKDEDTFWTLLAEAIEESAVQKSIDPEGEAPIKLFLQAAGYHRTTKNKMMKPILNFALGAGLLAICISPSLAEIKIDPSKPVGAKVNYFGWDLKGWQDNTSTPDRARILYSDVPANLVRIPIFARAHTEEGNVDPKPLRQDAGEPRPDSEPQSEVKIFASLKLLKSDTFPEWIESEESGKIFDATVKKPDPARYAQLLAGYIGWLRDQGVAIDFLGIGNETDGALSSDRYVETVRLLREELAKRKFEENYTSFQWIGPDSFGVPTALKFAREIDRERAEDTVDIWGCHFYPDLNSGTIDDWEELARKSDGNPVWHTELHVRNSEGDDNVAKIRDGLAIVFATNKAGVSGYVWWARAFEDKSMTNLIRHQVTRTLLGGACIETSGNYEAKGNRPSAVAQQATRVGDKVYLWVCNPGDEIWGETVNLNRVEVAGLSGICWRGPDSSGLGGQSELPCDPVQPGKPISLPIIPGNSISLFTFELKSAGPVAQPTAQGNKVLITERDWKSSAPGSKPVRAALIRIQNGVGTFETGWRHLHLSLEQT